MYDTQFFSWTQYGDRVGITFKPTPSISQRELYEIITALKLVHRYLEEEPMREGQ